MQKIKVDISSLGRKDPVVLPVDVKNVKKSLEFQADIYDMGKEVQKYAKADANESNAFDYLIAKNNEMSKQLEHTLDFITEMLDLTDEEVAKLDDMSMDEVYTISSQINSKLLNPKEEKIEDGGTPSEPQQSISEH